MKFLIYSDFEPKLQLKLRSQLPIDSEVIFKNEATAPQLKNAFLSAEIVFGNPPFTWFKDALPHLLFWQLDSTGFNQYQSISLQVPAANMGNYYAQQCAETIIGGILAFYRGIHRLTKLQELKKWEGKLIRPTLEVLGNKEVLILRSEEHTSELQSLMRISYT